jgi:nucleotide-binding universal stress UspA family protein
MKPIQRILVASDFSNCADAAAAVAAQLARQLNAAVDVVTVVDTSPLAEAYGDAAYRTQRINEIRAGARATAEEFAARHFAGARDVRAHVRDGHPFLEIIAAGQELGCDVIVMGTHGRTGVAHLVIGSVAEKVARKSPIPVLTVRGST